MNSETLKPKENPVQPPQQSSGYFNNLTEEQISEVAELRREELEKIKNQISRKLYYAIEEKLTWEQTRLQEILDWQQGKKTNMARYSFILDTHYFEQEFIQ